MATIILPIDGKIRRVFTGNLCDGGGKQTIGSAVDSVCGLSGDVYYVVCQGKPVSRLHEIEENQTYHVVPRILGGKGGFGSMLRSIGAQIEKTTNREACRDLSGRRMRDVNNEKKLQDWVSKQAQREKERAEKRRERMEQRRAEPRHKFDDPEYHEQKSQVAENLQGALQEGLVRATSSTNSVAPSTSTGKRKSDDKNEGCLSKKQKAAAWVGLEEFDELDTDSDSNSDGDSDEDQAGSSGDTSEENAKQAEVSDTNVEGGEQNCEKEKSAVGEKCRSASLAKLSPPTARQQVDHAETDSDSSDAKPAKTEQTGPVDLMSFDSAAALESLGLEQLKAELVSRGLKCGGTLEQRAERLWMVRGLSPDQYDKSLVAKPVKGKKLIKA